MRILTNQTIYQCEHCGKKNLSKKGAAIHEKDYCRHGDSIHMKNIKIKQDNCKHENTDTVYSYIPGEAVQEPDYDMCIDCGKHV